MMCGISGFFSVKHPYNSNCIVRMNNAIKHRGPDDEGYWMLNNGKGEFYAGKDSTTEIKQELSQLKMNVDCNIALGFRRLSILDLSSKGHQPMTNVQKDIIITFNGEIYNFRELRHILEQEGFVFKSETDTEVIVNGYQYWGTSIFEKLDGMFAICIVDLQKNRIILARDRIGLKPLFYYKNEDSICWASEIKSVLESDFIERKINWKGVYTNFLFQTTLSPQTCFENIFSLEPGSFMEISGNEKLIYKISKFWDLPSIINTTVSLENAVETVDFLLSRSIEKQLCADVPITVMMSGGIDSTLLMSKAHEIENEITAFTLDYQFENDEVKNAQKVASIKNFQHKVYKVSTEDFISKLKTDIQHFEEPYVSVEVLMHAAEIAHNNDYKVVLSGNGADEIFGGYSHVLKLDTWKKRRKFRLLKHAIPNVGAKAQKIRKYWEQKYLFDFFRQGQSGFHPSEVAKLFKEDDLKKIDTSLQKYRSEKGLSYLEYCKYDIRYSLSSHHVFRDDLSAMKHSVEFRYPYLSNELVNFVTQLPESYRFNGEINKPLLRKVASKELPKDVLEMPKLGFTFPLARFMNDNIEVRKLAENSLASIQNRNIFNNNYIEELFSMGISDENASRIWQLLTFELWLQKYFDEAKKN